VKNKPTPFNQYEAALDYDKVLAKNTPTFILKIIT